MLMTEYAYTGYWVIIINFYVYSLLDVLEINTKFGADKSP